MLRTASPNAHIYTYHISFHKRFETFFKPQAKPKTHIRKNPHRIMNYKYNVKMRIQEEVKVGTNKHSKLLARRLCLLSHSNRIANVSPSVLRGKGKKK